MLTKETALKADEIVKWLNYLLPYEVKWNYNRLDNSVEFTKNREKIAFAYVSSLEGKYHSTEDIIFILAAKFERTK